LADPPMAAMGFGRVPRAGIRLLRHLRPTCDQCPQKAKQQLVREIFWASGHKCPVAPVQVTRKLSGHRGFGRDRFHGRLDGAIRPDSPPLGDACLELRGHSDRPLSFKASDGCFHLAVDPDITHLFLQRELRATGVGGWAKERVEIEKAPRLSD
jgi:hypothetical protein